MAPFTCFHTNFRAGQSFGSQIQEDGSRYRIQSPSENLLEAENVEDLSNNFPLRQSWVPEWYCWPGQKAIFADLQINGMLVVLCSQFGRSIPAVDDVYPTLQRIPLTAHSLPHHSHNLHNSKASLHQSDAGSTLGRKIHVLKLYIWKQLSDWPQRHNYLLRTFSFITRLIVYLTALATKHSGRLSKLSDKSSCSRFDRRLHSDSFAAFSTCYA